VRLTVVIGGTRSGKSAHAEWLAAGTGLAVRYVATADSGDASMRGRIERHANRRPAAWTTVEAGPALADACAGAADCCVLLDGLGPWIATALHRAGAFDDDARLAAVAAEVLAELERTADTLESAGAAIVVAEHAGAGVLPPDAASRAWVDLLGDATQRLAARADRVDLVVAGRSITLGGRPGRPDPAGPGLEDRSLRRHGDRDVRVGDADHAVNVVAGGPPAWLRAALDAALAGDAGRYPHEDEAIAGLAGLHVRVPEEIVPTNGAAEALWLLAPALRPELAACVHPGFTEAEAALRAHGIPTTRVQRDPDRGFALDPAGVPDAADLVVVGNPASPSGTLDPATAILALRRPGRVVVVDEAFMELVPGQPASLVRERLADVIVVRSLTKALGVPGLRAGYAVTGELLADRLRAVRPPWSANVLALAALRAAATHPAELAAIAERAAADRADLHARLDRIPGVRAWPGVANFVLVAVADGPAVVAALRAERIAVRPAGSFPGLDDRYIRITARHPSANARLVDVLAAAVIGAPADRSTATW
jgi:histidinol-phosphate/aromatic aminotransferase/cobyric acid decarboxylase-like protein/adenosyl cobinamide kinase/adenosyl cobinamide phosphate guanylyltransferase